VTTIKALLKPKPLDEIRDPRERFDNVREVHAACGIKISAPNLERVVPGAPIRVANEDRAQIIEEIKSQSKIQFELDQDGVLIKADTIGSLEALVKESRDKGIHIRKADIGNVSKRDIVEATSVANPLDKAIFAFTVKLLPEAKEELANTDVVVFNEDVIYTILEKYEEWLVKKKEELDRERRVEFVHPGMIRFLPEYVFRASHPAVIGVRVMSGRIKTGMRLMKDDGRPIGSIKGIQSENKAIDEALQGQEVAISIEGITVGRQIKGDDILYTDIPEIDAKKLKEMDNLNADEKDLLSKIMEIKRKQDKFWGM
jgi:translation initiation factor 5B